MFDLGTSPLFAELLEFAERDPTTPTPGGRRQHFVPAFLLARFAQPSTRRGWLYQLERRTGQPKRTRPEDACHRKHLYSLEDKQTGLLSDLTVETFFAIVEKHAAPAMTRLTADQPVLSPADRQTLAEFLAFQYLRTPPALAQIEAATETATALWVSLEVHGRDFERRYRERVGVDATAQGLDEARREALDSYLSGSIDITTDNPAARGIFLAAEGAIEVFHDCSWTILRSENDRDQFVTSDRALAIVDPKPAFPWSGDAPASSDEVETTVPLDPRHSLVLRPGPCNATFDLADANTVKESNLRIYGWAERFVYSARQDSLQHLRRQAKRSPARVPTPRISRQVIVEDADPSDPSVGQEHVARGWPRLLQHTDEAGHQRAVAYRVLEPGDRRAAHAALVDNFSESASRTSHKD